MTNYMDIINALCEKFGTTVDYLLPKAQQYYLISNGISFAICLVLVLASIITPIAFKKAAIRRARERGSDWDYLEDWQENLCIALGVAGFIAFIVMFAYLYSFIGWKVAPEIMLIKAITK